MKKIYSLLLTLMVAAPHAWASSSVLDSIEPTAVEGQPTEVPSYCYTLAEAQALGRVAVDKQSSRSPRKATATAAVSTAYAFGLNGYESFPVSGGITVTQIADVNRKVSAGARAGDKIYVVDYTVGTDGSIHSSSLLTYNKTRHTFSQVANMDGNGPIIVDMAYSSATGKMYCLGSNRSTGGEALYTIDLTTGALTQIGADLDVHYYGLAVNRGGLLYAVSQNSNQQVQLVSINPANGSLTKIGSTTYINQKASYISSAAMDWSDNIIYWPLCNSDGYSYLAKIDASTGKTTLGTRIGSAQDEFMGLDIEYVKPDSAAPAAPANFTFTPDASGAVKATAQWTNPSTTYSGDALASISKVVVTVNGTVYKEITDAIPGSVSTLELTGLATGYARVDVVAYNGDLKGETAESMKWVGSDVPCAVTGITLERTSANEATLSWTAPTESVHSGYLRTSALKYRIVRYNTANTDSVVVAKTYRQGTTYVDNTIDKLGCYKYVIQSLTTDYGERATSPSAVCGPAADIPYVCTFQSDSTFGLWNTIDGNNDGTTWKNYVYQGYVYHLPKGVKADDWLITPPVKLEADSTYYIYFEFRSGMGEYYPKRMQVTVGTSPDDVTTHEVVWDYSWASRITEQCRVALPVSKTGEYYVGIHDISDFNSCTIRLTNFCIITKHTGWVTGKVTDTDGQPLEGVRVTIPNSNIVDTTGTDGAYKLDFVPTGTYEVTYTKLNYTEVTDSVSFVNDQESVHNTVLSRIPTHTISGILADVNGKAIANAIITLKGYGDTRTAVTGAKGTFAFADVTDHGYRVTVNKAKYKTWTDSIDLAADKALAITLDPKLLEPSDYASKVGEQAVTLTWNQPREIYRHDDGTIGAQLGSLSGTAKTVNGAVFTEKAVIKSISWVTTSYQGPHNEVNLWIFDIDTLEHKPVSKVLFNAMHVASKGDEVWNTYELPQPVEAPNGFFLGISYDNGMSSLATDSGTDPDYPFVPLTNYMANDYTTGEWRLIDKSFVKRNHLIRATGDEYTSTPQTYDYRYRVWRLLEDDFLDQDKWTALTPAEGITATTLTDSLTSLAAGNYYYAIAAVYPDGELSEILYSDNITVEQSGITSASIAAGLVIAPNPVDNVLRINQTCDKVEFFSAAGSLSLTATATNAVDVSSLAPGVYLMRATIGGHSVIKRVVKK